MKQVYKTSLLTKTALIKTTLTKTTNCYRMAIAVSMATLLGSCGPIASSGGLKIGSLLPSTGDLSSVGQPMIATVPLLVDTVNACGGVNGKPMELVAADDETDPTKGNQAMTQLAEVDKVAGVVGSFASSVSTSAVDVAVRVQSLRNVRSKGSLRDIGRGLLPLIRTKRELWLS
jgi:ABC-type branched-subunit amino acid transport system substrate-binding protein